MKVKLRAYFQSYSLGWRDGVALQLVKGSGGSAWTGYGICPRNVMFPTSACIAGSGGSRRQAQEQLRSRSDGDMRERGCDAPVEIAVCMHRRRRQQRPAGAGAADRQQRPRHMQKRPRCLIPERSCVHALQAAAAAGRRRSS